MQNPTVQTPFGLAEIVVRPYTRGGRPAVILSDGNTGEPIATLSVNLPSAPDPGKGCTYIKDYSENASLVHPMLESGLFVDTGRRYRAGFV